MIFYRTGQSWFQGNLIPWNPEKLVLFICNSKPGAPSQSLPGRQPHPHSPEKTAQRNLFHLRRKTGRCLVLSVWIDVCVSVSLVIFDNSAQVLSSYFNGLKTRQPLQTQLLPIQENFDLRECQSPVNWELVNMKYLVVLFCSSTVDMSKSHQHEAQNVHSASVCSKVKIAISFYLSQACQQESTSKEQEQNEKLNVI